MFTLRDMGKKYGAYIITDVGADDPAYAMEVADYGGRLVAESVSADYAPILAAAEVMYDLCKEMADDATADGCYCELCVRIRKARKIIELIEEIVNADN